MVRSASIKMDKHHPWIVQARMYALLNGYPVWIVTPYGRIIVDTELIPENDTDGTFDGEL